MFQFYTCLLSFLFFSFSPGEHVPRTGDEIVAAGQFFHTGAPVVLWMDPCGYDAYRVERRFAPFDRSEWKESQSDNPQLSTPNRYGIRLQGLSPEELVQVRGGGWDLFTLQKLIDQVVLHYDNCGVSGNCFKQLHDNRGLSCHFLIDIDGTIYQTLDLKERAWHATIANNRSIGIEIANIGAFPPNEISELSKWYETGPDGIVRLKLPPKLGDGQVRTKNFEGTSARDFLINGEINGTKLGMYDYTSEQYDSLIKLTASLCRIFPELKSAFPTESNGQVINRKLSEDEFRQFKGFLGHYHVQSNKMDPGPALQWDRIKDSVTELLK